MEQQYNPFSLTGKRVLVTGASSGIGRECAIECSRMGAQVLLVARREEELQSTLSAMEGTDHALYPFDLNQIDGLKDLVSQMVSEHGKLDGYVHAAGLERTMPVKLLKPSDYEELYRVNTLSAMELSKQLTSIKHINKGSSLVYIASITAGIARSGVAAYAASKGALISAARVLALEIASRGIRVNTVSPGTVLTPLMQRYLASLTEDQYAERVSGFPLGLGKECDVTRLIIYLLSDASRWMTGQNIVIDGGYTIK